MCGRFTLRTPAKDFAEIFRLADVPDLQPRYNIAPSQPVAAVRSNPKDGHRELVMLHWGLIPFWAEDPKIGYSTINARTDNGCEQCRSEAQVTADAWRIARRHIREVRRQSPGAKHQVQRRPTVS